VAVELDASIGPGFEATVVDLNGDGRLDLLVTNHVGDPALAGVYAYEAPPAGTPLTDAAAWTRHTLASGFVVREAGPNGTQAAPGAARVLAPCAAPVDGTAAAQGARAATTKPLISLAGDGDQRFYLLQPTSAAPTDWTYSLSLLHDCGGTAGRQAHADVDGDGCPELFLPCFDSSTVHVYRLDRA